VVVDSTADMDPQEAAELGIEVVPHTVYWDGIAFLDRVELSVDEFYRKLREEKGTPRTSQPSVGQFQSVYTRLLREVEGIVSLHVSSALSGTINTARLAAESVDPERIVVLDSQTLSGALGCLATRVARLGQKGADLSECVALAGELIPRLRLFIAMDTLEYLRRGGRAGLAQTLAAQLLSIKPIIQLLDGVFSPLDRVRTRSAAVRRLARAVEELGLVEEVSVLYGDNRQPAEELYRLIREQNPFVDILWGRTGPACGTHGGPGLFGVSVLLASNTTR
jgi:DegV family protein with EDD domain